MTYETYLVIPVNPVPWTAPSVAFKQKKVYKSAELVAFQAAVKEHVVDRGLDLLTGDLEVHFWFWRRLDEGTTGGRKRRGHQADATNMQKAIEDALQGVLFNNDRDNRKVTGQIVDQGPNVTPGIIVGVSQYHASGLDIPEWALMELTEQPVLTAPEHDPDVEAIF